MHRQTVLGGRAEAEKDDGGGEKKVRAISQVEPILQEIKKNPYFVIYI